MERREGKVQTAKKKMVVEANLVFPIMGDKEGGGGSKGEAWVKKYGLFHGCSR